MKDEEKTELNKKLLNYKTEYYEILNKFKEIQDNYINKKTENALMDEELIDEEDKDKNNIRITTGTNGTNNSALGAGNPYMVDGELEEENNKKNNLNKIKKENEKKNNDIKNNGGIKLMSTLGKIDFSNKSKKDDDDDDGGIVGLGKKKKKKKQNKQNK